MSTQESIKLSDYVEYPFLIPRIDLNFDIRTDCVFVQSRMIIKPKHKESTKLILNGSQIELLSISINARELKSNLRSPNCGNVTMFKSQIGGLALNRQKWSEMGIEWSPGPENRSP